MRPRIIISNKFLEKISKLENSSRLPTNDYEITISQERVIKTISIIRNILNSADIYSSIKEEEIKEEFESYIGRKQFLDFRSYIIFQWIKKNCFNNSNVLNSDEDHIIESLLKDKSFLSSPLPIIFSDYSDTTCENIENKLGIITRGKNYSLNDFFDKSSTIGVTDAKMEEINKCLHPTSFILISDPYLFKDAKLKEAKMPNLLKTIKSFLSIDSIRPIKISILAGNPLDDTVFETKCKIIEEGLNKFKVDLLITTPKWMNESDRWFLTSYSFMIAGHPFDRETSFAYNFMLREDEPNKIIQNYNIYSKKLDEFRSVITKTKNYESFQVDKMTTKKFVSRFEKKLNF